MKTLIFATRNRHKLDEVQAVLGNAFRLVTPDQMGVYGEAPEDELTLEGNALQKAEYLYAQTGGDCFADDTGLEVDALDGAPGVFSARYGGEHADYQANNRLLLENLCGATDRRARFRTVIALILGGERHLFEGRIEGSITTEPRGEEGFGYDPLFIPEGYTITFAEMDAEEKNAISHRGRAVRKLSDYLSRTIGGEK